MKESNEGGLIKRQENGTKGSRNPDVQKMALKKEPLRELKEGMKTR